MIDLKSLARMESSRLYIKTRLEILDEQHFEDINQIFRDIFSKLLIGFLSRGGCYRELPRNVDRSPNICAQ